MANNDTIGKTITVTLALCIVCSIVVSSAAVFLRDMQEANKARDFKRNILQAAGLYQEGVAVEEQFKSVTTKAIDFSTGKFTDAIDIASYDQAKAAKDPALSTKLSGDADIAKIGSQENVGLVYMVEKDGALERRFQKVMVEPTSVDETVQILHNIKDKYEEHH
ncbi:MAG: hypothetical protein VXZ35_06465, partial [Pseudomonadota bacterium]|nr:hypothetical protein [Pseudomonadota bacterium]